MSRQRDARCGDRIPDNAGCPANVGLSCEPREQAERRASDALRSVGVRQIQALVGLLLGPGLTR